jgi:UTP--glucose-1-phosphate uridylyltransferase
MNKVIKKAIFPVGGLGTRFLPATKSMPKEMMPIASKPLIQHAFEEAMNAGIEQFIFITGRNKNAINNHFDHMFELEQTLSGLEKAEALRQTCDWLPEAGNVMFIRQQKPLGLGHAVWCARHLINEGEPFAVLLADELFMLNNGNGMLGEMVDLYKKQPGNIIAVADVEPKLTNRYGIVDPEHDDGRVIKVRSMVEKPSIDQAPSNISITGRYILSPEIFPILERKIIGSGGEIQLTDAMCTLLESQKFYGLRLDGKRLDCGNHLGYLEANIEYALADNSLHDGVMDIIEAISTRSK